MENITNFARGAEAEVERDEDLAADEYAAEPDVPDDIFGELPPAPAAPGRDRAARAAEDEREGEALLPPE